MFIIVSKIKFAFLSIFLGILLLGASTAARADTMAYFEGSGEFGTIDLNNGAISIINSNNGLAGAAGLGVFNGTLYAATNNGGINGQLYSINPATGVATFIASSGVAYSTFGSTSSGLFAYVTGGSLASINPSTGAATTVGSPEGALFPAFSTSSDSSSLYEFNASNQLTDHNLESIDTTNGNVSVLGSNLGGVQSMLEVGGTLYAIYLPSAPGSAWGLYTLNGSGATEIYSPESAVYFNGLAPDPLTSRPVPEPFTFLLVGSGLIPFIRLRKKRSIAA